MKEEILKLIREAFDIEVYATSDSEHLDIKGKTKFLNRISEDLEPIIKYYTYTKIDYPGARVYTKPYTPKKGDVFLWQYNYYICVEEFMEPYCFVCALNVPRIKNFDYSDYTAEYIRRATKAECNKYSIIFKDNEA